MSCSSAFPVSSLTIWKFLVHVLLKPSLENFEMLIPAKQFQILKDDTVKVLQSIYLQIWKTQQWPQDWKRLFFIPIPKKGNAKECSNYNTIVHFSHASQVMLKIQEVSLHYFQNIIDISMVIGEMFFNKECQLKF